jgi:hypothetical protein
MSCTVKLDAVRQLGAQEQPVAGYIRSRVLRDRDDEHGLGAKRSIEIWC